MEEIKLKEAVVKKKVRTKISKNPDENKLIIRVFKNNSIYPSKKLVDELNLEYLKDENNELIGNGFDIFSSDDWNQYDSQEYSKNIFLLLRERKNNKSIDLFSFGKLPNVMEQGSKKYNFDDLFKEYNINREVDYVDLELEEVEVSTVPFLMIPKKVKKKDGSVVVNEIKVDVNKLFKVKL